ncbi:MAG: hypothetical protein HY308_16155 [Gammaproteobacteria bacterium]|nr:hypothetical protein [Gammaproteobacteria bacterium]
MKVLCALPAAFAFVALTSYADDGIATTTSSNVKPQWDIVRTQVTTEKQYVVFRMQVSGRAGKNKPTKTGQLAGSRVFSYVWPTSLDPAEVGFDANSGILAFAVTAHPDFDDSPLFDENGDGNLDNDGNVWHSHWVVLTPDDACGAKGLKVRDIAEGTTPKLPKTWPGLPIYIDSPGYSPVLTGSTVTVRVPFDNIGAVSGAKFDGVTAGLRVNTNLHAPLLCVENVFKVASGDLSLPGTIQ